MLNQTNGRQLEDVHREFFARWPTPLHLACASPAEVERLITPLGLQGRRTRQLIRMSTVYSCIWEGDSPNELPAIGEYGSDSYMLFIRGALDILPRDKELKRYLEWIRES